MTAVDLSRLPPPQLVDDKPVETIMAEALPALVDAMQAYHPGFSTPMVSDPAYRLIEQFSYRERWLRQRINNAALSVLLAKAEGADLDHFGAGVNVARLDIDPEAGIKEQDDPYRQRIQAAFESFTTAGARGAYEFWARSASAQVKDARAESPDPCQVVVSVLSTEGDGTADSGLLGLVTEVLSEETIRPLGDQLTVQSATIVSYTVTAEITVGDGPDAELVRQAAEDSCTAYCAARHRLGATVSIAGLYSSLMVEGVVDVDLTFPEANVTTTGTEAPHPAAINITLPA